MRHLNRVHLSGLRAAEAVIRHGSLAGAAGELEVSVGAVSQRIARLEQALGRRLFDRHAAGMTPTALGRDMAAPLNAGFGQLSAALDGAFRDRAHSLTVAAAPIFAARWLIWKLPRFAERHPDIQVRIDASPGLVDPNTGEADLCLRVGRGDWPGVRAEKLYDQRVTPLCAPAVAARLHRPEDLALVPIIRDALAMYGWECWLGPEGLSAEILGPGPVLSDGSLCLDAAISGAGVYLGWETIDLHALATGQLVAPFPGRHETGLATWLVSAADRAPGAAQRYFTRWMKEELAADGIALA
ncbi:MAG: LysR family transcriptional regulator [Maritimibacter sp.]|nr:LysR family transcriptional regulator [Maritimibacter sp.]MCB2111588.1 LysR family transcriptional regulator [Paracoccaceae bacterium]